MFYSRKEAYDGWAGLEKEVPMIQVFRADTRLTASFEDNWHRQVWIQVWTQNGKGQRLDCPAGCLFQVLKEGDLDFLHSDRPGHTPDGLGAKLRNALKEIDGPSEVFALPFDLVNQESVWKIGRVGQQFNQDPKVTTPDDLGAQISVRPTVHIAMLDLTDLSDAKIEDRLRRGVNPHAKKVSPGSHGVRF